MGTADQRFNVDVAFLFGSIWATQTPRDVRIEGGEIFDQSTPNWTGALTDWGRRVTSLPSLRKSVENWTGKFEIADLNFDLFDGDQGVYSTLYATGSPFGKTVGMFVKVIDNPEFWTPIFVGGITGIKRSKSLTSITVEDALRNLLNSQFVPDYYCFATTIGGNIYGTVTDIIATNVYMEDLGKVTLIEREVKGQDSGWMVPVVGGIVGGALALLTGGIGGAISWGAVGVGAGAGFLSGIPTAGGGYKQRWYNVEDFNAIPDGLVFGGQSIKFHVGSFSGRADGVHGSLYSVPSYSIQGGTFVYGIHGTIEIDDIYNGVRKGDYAYSQLPLIYYGSPDEVIVNMLTGSNSSVQYNFPNDFATNWISSAEPLKQIECWKTMDKFEPGVVAESISELCAEFGFTFYINESNKFAIRTIREANLDAAEIIGTLDERYNVIGDGFSRVDELKTSFTDIRLRFKNSRIGEGYNQEIRATTFGATYFGGARRVLEIDANWIHDLLTGEFIATRLMRRYATIIPRIEGDVSLYSVPVELGELMKCTGWAVGTNHTYEIISYTKDFHSNQVRVELEDAEPLYRYQRFFYFATVSGAVYSGCQSGWATIISAIAGTFGWAGTLREVVSNSQSQIELYHLQTAGEEFNNIGSFSELEGRYFRIGTLGEELLYGYARTAYSTSISGNNYQVSVYKVDRGCFDTMVGQYSSAEKAVVVNTPFATVFGAGTTWGTYMRWF